MAGAVRSVAKASAGPVAGSGRSRVRTGEALREIERKLPVTLDSITAIIFIKNLEGRYIFVNAQFRKLLVRNSRKILGKTDKELFGPAQAAAFMKNDRKVLRAGAPMEFEEVAEHADGPHHSIVSRFPLRDGAGKVFALCGLATDITARRRAENALRESKACFEVLFESAPDAVLVVNQEGRVIQANSRVKKVLGYPRKELLGRPIEELIPERLRNVHVSHRGGYQSRPRLRSMGAGLELAARRKDGSKIPVDVMLSPLKTPEGPAVLCQVRDITARKKVEDALRESEERYRTLVEGIRDYSIFALDLKGTILSVNRGVERVHGYRPQEVIGKNISIFHSREQIAEGRPARELQVATQKGRFEENGWRLRKGGSQFWANLITVPVHDRAGEVRGFSRIVRDITGRLVSEVALQDSEERFRLGVEGITQYAICMLDLGGHVITWNLGAERIYGYSILEAVGKHLSAFYLPRDIQAGAPQKSLEAAAALGSCESEGWQVRKDGSQFWAAASLSSLRDNAGKLRGYCKVTSYISARKRRRGSA